MKNRLSDLRNHLFETIEALKDPDRPLDVDRARAIAGVAQVIIASAKVEVDMVKAVSSDQSSSFFDGPGNERRRQLEQPGALRLNDSAKQ